MTVHGRPVGGVPLPGMGPGLAPLKKKEVPTEGPTTPPIANASKLSSKTMGAPPAPKSAEGVNKAAYQPLHGDLPKLHEADSTTRPLPNKTTERPPSNSGSVNTIAPKNIQKPLEKKTPEEAGSSPTDAAPRHPKPTRPPPTPSRGPLPKIPTEDQQLEQLLGKYSVDKELQAAKGDAYTAINQLTGEKPPEPAPPPKPPQRVGMGNLKLQREEAKEGLEKTTSEIKTIDEKIEASKKELAKLTTGEGASAFGTVKRAFLSKDTDKRIEAKQTEIDNLTDDKQELQEQQKVQESNIQALDQEINSRLPAHRQYQRKAVTSLINDTALKNSVGIFRVAGAETSKVENQKKIENHQPLDPNLDVNTKAQLIKENLRELRPLSGLSHERLAEIANMDPKEGKAALQAHIKSLPKDEQEFVNNMLSKLREIAGNSANNKMTPSNLSIVIGPNIFMEASATADPAAFAKSMQDQNKLAQWLIEG